MEKTDPKNLKKLFGVNILIQKKLVEDLCFDKCGKISIGAMEINKTPGWLPCWHKDCPYMEKEAELGPTDVPDGIGKTKKVNLWMRKLKRGDEK